jgi:hypothetical protein
LEVSGNLLTFALEITLLTLNPLTMDELQNIQNLIYEIRGVRVMLDKDLAELYHVTTGNLNKAVKRNIRRFPPDFMFQLTKEEWDSLRFQIGILETGRGRYTKFLPHAFTEQGLAMLSGVLNSDIAIDVNISIMRAFVSLRRVSAVVRKGDLIEMRNSLTTKRIFKMPIWHLKLPNVVPPCQRTSQKRLPALARRYAYIVYSNTFLNNACLRASHSEMIFF